MFVYAAHALKVTLPFKECFEKAEAFHREVIEITLEKDREEWRAEC